MIQPANYRELTCVHCAEGDGLDFDFTLAFQPIVDIETREVYAHEALVRGLNGETAAQMLAQVNPDNRYRFDQTCRVRAIELGTQLGLPARLSVNILPKAIYRPETCIRATLQAASTYNFPISQIIFELIEGEKVAEHEHLKSIIREYQRLGFSTAIDDFGAGYSGLNLLADFQPDYIKLDMALTRAIDQDRVRQFIVKAIVQVCSDLSIVPIAEGVETHDEAVALSQLGIRLQQGYYFARPLYRALAAVPAARFDGLGS